MSVEQTVTDQVTRAHGLEIDTQGVRPCSDIWFVHTGAKTSKDDTLANWLVNRLSGCGQVHLVQLKVHASGAAKESLYVGISAVGTQRVQRIWLLRDEGSCLFRMQRMKMSW